MVNGVGLAVAAGDRVLADFDNRSGSMAGPMGLLVILVVAVATILLLRNMTARLRRLPDRFPSPDDPAPGDRTDPAPGDRTDPAPGDRTDPAPGSAPTSAFTTAGNDEGTERNGTS